VRLIKDTVVEYSYVLSGSDIAADGSYTIPVEYSDTSSDAYVQDAIYTLAYNVYTIQ